jgi:hypothetical protein
VIYPDGAAKTPRLLVKEDEEDFAAFQACKVGWLPLVPEEELAAALGCGSLECSANAPTATWDVNLSALPSADRPFLVYCPTKAGDHLADLLSEHRLFDVAFNDYTGEGRGTEGAEWRFCEKGHKWPCAHRISLASRNPTSSTSSSTTTLPSGLMILTPYSLRGTH